MSIEARSSCQGMRTRGQGITYRRPEPARGRARRGRRSGRRGSPASALRRTAWDSAKRLEILLQERASTRVRRGEPPAPPAAPRLGRLRPDHAANNATTAEPHCCHRLSGRPKFIVRKRAAAPDLHGSRTVRPRCVPPARRSCPSGVQCLFLGLSSSRTWYAPVGSWERFPPPSHPTTGRREQGDLSCHISYSHWIPKTRSGRSRRNSLRSCGPELPSLIKEIGVEVTRAYPEYARLLDGPNGQAIRVGVEQSLASFVDLVAEPSSPTTLRDDMCRRFGRFEAYEGRSMDTLRGPTGWARAGGPAAGEEGRAELPPVPHADAELRRRALRLRRRTGIAFPGGLPGGAVPVGRAQRGPAPPAAPSDPRRTPWPPGAPSPICPSRPGGRCPRRSP